MDIKAIEKVVGQIQSQLFKNSNNISVGMLKSSFRGTGLTFKEHQVYSFGDDVRFLDWNLLAKTNTPYIKTFEEERNVEIVVIIDMDPSMYNGYKNVSKLQASIEICCLLYLLASKTGDIVRPILVGDEIINLPAKAGKEGIVQLITALEKKGLFNEDGKVDISYRPQKSLPADEKYVEVVRHLARQKEVVLLSDFVEFLPLKGIKTILSKSNVHCFKITSPVDDLEKNSFTVYGRSTSSQNLGGSTIFSINKKKRLAGTLEKLLGKKLKKINVKDRYLEEFVREMI